MLAQGKALEDADERLTYRRFRSPSRLGAHHFLRQHFDLHVGRGLKPTFVVGQSVGRGHLL